MNPMIALSARTPQFAPPESPANKMMELLKMQSAVQDQEMGAMKADEYKRTTARTSRMEQILSGGGDATALRTGGFLKEANEWEKSAADTAHQKSAAAKNAADTTEKVMAQYRDQLGNVTNPQQAAQWLQAQYQDPTLSPMLTRFGSVQQAISSIPQDQAGFADWIKKQSLGMKLFIEKNAPTTNVVNTGGTTQMVQTPGLGGAPMVAGAFQNTQSPDSAAKIGEERRHNTSMEGFRGSEINQGKTQVIVDPTRGPMLVNKTNATSQPVTMGGQPVMGEIPAKQQAAAQKTIPILDEADKLIDQATGSYIGAGVDVAGRAFGGSTGGADAIAKLKVLEGQLMMSQPRMEGPQSDKDVQLYRQMAGQIGDPTVPADMKKAALSTIREIQTRYAGPRGATQGGGLTPAEQKELAALRARLKK